VDKDGVRFTVGAGIGIGGVGLQMTGAPHWVGWLVAASGVGICLWPYLLHLAYSAPEQHGPNDLRDTLSTTASPTLATPAVITRDAWLQDALCFALYGHWPAADEEVFREVDVLEKVGSLVSEMRELAGEGKFNVWGKTHELRLYEPIPPAFWINNLIDYMSMWGPPENPKTEQITGLRNSESIYRALMVSRVQAEAIWPPNVLKEQGSAPASKTSRRILISKPLANHDENVSSVVEELKASVASLKVQARQQFLASTALIKLIDHRLSLRASFDKLSKSGPALSAMIKIKASETVLTNIFDMFYLPVQRMQEDCKTDLDWRGDMLLGWGKDARTDVAAPNEDTFPADLLIRYRAAHQVFLKADETLGGFIETAKRKISEAGS
jgi:hypothetical protein